MARIGIEGPGLAQNIASVFLPPCNWRGRQVGIALSLAVIATAGIVSLITENARDNPWHTWVEEECTLLGAYCWQKICHYEETCSPFGWECIVEKVCLHLV